ncbi:MAG TPA: putative DNA modification/repair radical SAM protein [Campylobacterales bacterium]|nr:putative DNA modification/repair radical SAM protein [Campylobacterales bacterium]
MILEEKLEILSDAAKYDSSCSSSGSDRASVKGGIGSCSLGGICHTFTSDGRCVSLLKVLLTNHCILDCAYCKNRVSNDLKRAAFAPEELAKLTIEFYRRNFIEGLFLSSGIVKSADHTMELMIRCAKILRHTYRFGGYIHIKLIPGASDELVREISALADRVSSNIELPSEESLKLLAPQKSRQSVLEPLKIAKEANISMSTQMIVGASPESDFDIIRLSESLYKNRYLKRVYYSAYIPVNFDKRLPVPTDFKPPLLREHRLYQADWLLRFYKFRADEILCAKEPFLDERLDPKSIWALKNIHLFPIDINRASYEELIRIPGLGLIGAKKIIEARRYKKLGLDELKTLKISIKKSRFFITAKGYFPTEAPKERAYLALANAEAKTSFINLFSLNGEVAV